MYFNVVFASLYWRKALQILMGLKTLIWWILFHFCLKLKFKKQPFCVYRGPWNINTPLKKTPFAFCLLKISKNKMCNLKEIKKFNLKFMFNNILKLKVATLCLLEPKGYFNFPLWKLHLVFFVKVYQNSLVLI